MPCVLGGGFVIADSCHAQHPEHEVAVIVEERVPGVRILLDVVRPRLGAVLGSVAADDRARAGKEALGVLGTASVVDAGGREAVVGGEREGEPAASN